MGAGMSKQVFFAAMAALVPVGCAISAEPTATSLVEWLSRAKETRARYQDSIPDSIRDQLSKSRPDFLPLSFGSESAEVVRGDFNCDGKEDYAVSGVSRASGLAKALLAKNTPTSAIGQAKKEFDAYLNDQPAVVVIALSTAEAIVWQEASGSYVANRGADCGCCHGVSNSDLSWIKQHRCDFLYIGCCEKDGSYTIYDTNGIGVRYSSGC
jgi:hypothetical protein